MSDLFQWTLTLDEYEAINLAAVLAHIADHPPTGVNYNTGDWVNQIRWKLPYAGPEFPKDGLQPNEISQ